MSDVPTIELHVDQQPHRVTQGTTLAQLVAQLGHAPQDVGTAVNGRFVARQARAQHPLAPGDQVLLFQPITGG